jgi:hypothetical protein
MNIFVSYPKQSHISAYARILAQISQFKHTLKPSLNQLKLKKMHMQFYPIEILVQFIILNFVTVRLKSKQRDREYFF